MRGDLLYGIGFQTSVVATAAASQSSEKIGKAAVLAHAVGDRDEERPAATREQSRVQNVLATRTEEKQDDERPKAAVAIQARHSFSSFLSAAEYVIVEVSAVFYHIVCEDVRNLCFLSFIRLPKLRMFAIMKKSRSSERDCLRVSVCGKKNFSADTPAKGRSDGGN